MSREKQRSPRYSAEVKKRAVRLVKEHLNEYESEWATIRSIAPKIGCTAETLRAWIRKQDRSHGMINGMSLSERDRLKALEQENRELKRANDILRKASAYFAQAEFDRRVK